MGLKQNFFLRKFTREDVFPLYKALSDKRVIKHMATDLITLETCEEIVSDAIRHWKKYSIGSYAVEDPQSNSIVGWAGFKHWKENQFELLIVLSPDYWGSGREICKDLLFKAKNKFLLKEVFVLLPTTRKTFRWIEKEGFRYVGDEVFNGEPFKKFVFNLTV